MATIPTTPRTEPPQLHPLVQRLKAWRATRPSGQRIPEDLWKAAADLARVHGLNPTAAALKLSYYDLQRRVSGANVPRRRRVPRASFVQLAPPALLPVPGPEGTLELVQASGARLILRFPNARPRDLLSMVQLFLRHRS
jgi:hypothetical protein